MPPAWKRWTASETCSKRACAWTVCKPEQRCSKGKAGMDGADKLSSPYNRAAPQWATPLIPLNRLNSSAFSGTHLFCQHKAKRNTTHSGGASFWSIFDLRCKSPACGDFYRKAEGNPQRFPSQTPPSSRRTKDSAFVRRKELAADTHARSAFQSEVRQGLCVEPISSMPRAWI